jgi:hypothetical protein
MAAKKGREIATARPRAKTAARLSRSRSEIRAKLPKPRRTARPMSTRAPEEAAARLMSGQARLGGSRSPAHHCRYRGTGNLLPSV